MATENHAIPQAWKEKWAKEPVVKYLKVLAAMCYSFQTGEVINAIAAAAK